MNSTKRKKLTAAGWKVGSAADFLELTPEESVKCPKCNETVSHNLNKNNNLQHQKKSLDKPLIISYIIGS